MPGLAGWWAGEQTEEAQKEKKTACRGFSGWTFLWKTDQDRKESTVPSQGRKAHPSMEGVCVLGDPGGSAYTHGAPSVPLLSRAYLPKGGLISVEPR
jgi:hypothetical protein